jgi:hypothetical protein
MWLPGNKTKDFRLKLCDIITSYFAVDPSTVLIPQPRATVISFHPLVTGPAGVRVTDHPQQLLCAVDLVMVCTGKNRNDAARILRRLNADILDSSKKMEAAYLAAHDDKKTILATVEQALRLVTCLPGNVTEEFRSHARDIITRYEDAFLIDSLAQAAFSESKRPRIDI